ncbi:hypothetical protein [Georgenia yuyongxinii]|uniref:Uncharacterized protein n=1 Tax=Georgenia yuyongxinii TaxID=2589797 RepID=A0A552WP98_9MICO|nr:hypothetical protein [Georgenia yuyongxinii]TRW44590.1 hypothetical protein FJ693_12905 [Georgenia yuyongxinii]
MDADISDLLAALRADGAVLTATASGRYEITTFRGRALDAPTVLLVTEEHLHALLDAMRPDAVEALGPPGRGEDRAHQLLLVHLEEAMVATELPPEAIRVLPRGIVVTERATL